MHKFLMTIFRGIGQIMLQGNAATGMLILAGIFYGSVLMGIAAFIAAACGAITAKLLRYDRKELETGLYCFSPALAGAAFILFFKPVLIVWGFIAMASAATAVVQHFFIMKKIPVFTFPFVLVTWAMLYLVKYFCPAIMVGTASTTVGVSHNFLFAIRGFGQAIFQSNVLSGSVFFIAIFISSPAAAIYGLAGAIVSAIFSFCFFVPVGDVAMGLFSYNAVLCAIAFAGNKIEDAVCALISVLLSASIGLLMFKHNLPQLTFPFVIASFITWGLKHRFGIEK
ncbi:MAG: urea transporter [Bacteroidetes bacterium]|nr:urea transporter [Bacteroidota bacterium]MBS1974800.1 urea transporter [Bacteroidota bacterium]